MSLNNNAFDIELTDLKLIIITVESKILNIKFDTNTLINDILNLINTETNQKTDVINENDEIKEKDKDEIKDKEYILPDDIIKIGCNYGEYISEKYIELTTKVKKSNRGRKKKEKKSLNENNKEIVNISIVKLHLLY